MSATDVPDGRPVLSALLVTQDRIERLNMVLPYLSAQTICNQIELVFSAPSAETLGLNAEAFKDFAAVCVMESPSATTREELFAAAAFAATAPLVVMVEDHCFPDPDWAENLVLAHEASSYAAVGPMLFNANPDSAASWTSFIIGFGDWIAPVTTREAACVAAHNTCYRREVLTGYSLDELSTWLRFELRLHNELWQKGHHLLVSSKCRVHHVNISKWASLLVSQMNTSRNFGALRAERWSMATRLLYIAGAPLIPLRLLTKMSHHVRRVVPPHLQIATMCWLFLANCAMGLGELLGYTVGAGNTIQKMVSYELERMRYVSEHDKAVVKAQYGR